MVWGPIVRSTALAASLIAANGAYAGNNDFIVGMGVGILGNALMNSMNQQNNRAPPPRRQRDDIPYGERRYLDGGHDAARDARAADLAAKKAEEKRIAEASRQEMMAIQTRLKALNFNIDKIDGKNGGQTKTAIRAFQASIGTAQTGVLDENQKRILIAQTSSDPNGPSAQPPVAALQPLDPTPLQPAITAPPPSPGGNLPPLSNSLPTPGNLQLGSTAQSSASVPDAAILGVKPLQTNTEAHRALAAANIAPNCHDGKNSIVCLSQTAQMTDEILIGTTALDTTTVVHSAVRTMKFTPPIARTKIAGMLSASYPTLMSGPSQVASSGGDCLQAAEPYRGSDFAALKAWIRSGADPDPAIAKFSSRCAFYDEISIPAGETVGSISIALFAGKPIFNSLSEVGSMGAGTSASVENVSAPASPEIHF